MRKVFLMSLFLVTGLKTFACPGTGNWNMNKGMGPGNMGNMMQMGNNGSGNGMMGCQMSMVRHHYYMQNGIPSEFANESNPLTVDEKVLAKGKKIYEKNCLACHGEAGIGNGEAGKNLTPKPTNLAMFAKMPMATDQYLFWTINEGGEKINTAMPSFRKNLSKDEIWSTISYIRKM